jgi:hypothetical protein
VMVARLVRPVLRPLPGQVACMAASCCFRMTWRFAPPCASVVTLELCVWAPRTSRSQTCRARRRLVGYAVVRPRTGCLASEGLDEDLHAFPETQLQVKCALLLDVAVSKGTTILKLLAS